MHNVTQYKAKSMPRVEIPSCESQFIAASHLIDTLNTTADWAAEAEETLDIDTAAAVAAVAVVGEVAAPRHIEMDRELVGEGEVKYLHLATGPVGTRNQSTEAAVAAVVGVGKTAGVGAVHTRRVGCIETAVEEEVVAGAEHLVLTMDTVSSMMSQTSLESHMGRAEELSSGMATVIALEAVEAEAGALVLGIATRPAYIVGEVG